MESLPGRVVLKEGRRGLEGGLKGARKGLEGGLQGGFKGASRGLQGEGNLKGA